MSRIVYPVSARVPIHECCHYLSSHETWSDPGEVLHELHGWLLVKLSSGRTGWVKEQDSVSEEAHLSVKRKHA